MSERRFTRSAARAVEEQTITIKREQQSSARQAQQRAARQTNDITAGVIHIDIDEESWEQTSHAATQQGERAVVSLSSEVTASMAADELPALEGQDERKESTTQAEQQQLPTQLEEMAAALGHSLPPLELPTLQQTTPQPPQPPPHPADHSIKKEEQAMEWEEKKEYTVQSVSVKSEVYTKVEKKEKEEENEVDVLSSMVVEQEEEKKEGVSDDEPIAMRLSRRARTVPSAAAGRVQRVRRVRRAVQYDESSSSDSDSSFEAEDSGDDDADDGEDSDGDGDDEYGDELDGEEDDVISLSSDAIDALPANEQPPLPFPPDETDLLLSSTSPATFISPFLNFAPTTIPPLTDRYCLTLALSSRSRCRRCREHIVAGYPRIGQHARLCSHLITRWYHPSCWTLTTVDDGRQRIGGRLGALISAEEKERVRQAEGRLERQDEYETLIAQLNEKERASWKKSLAALEKRKQNIAEWRESGGVRRGHTSTRKRKTKGASKKKTTKAGKAGKKKKKLAETESSGEEWVEEQQEEERKEDDAPRVKRERRLKREAGVKKEVGVKREPRVKEERQVMVKLEGRVKRERGEENENEVDEDEQAMQGNKRAVKKE